MDTNSPIGFEQFYGVYRGISPTDESPIAIGELEASLTQEGLKLRHATGLEIQEHMFKASEILPMTHDEVKSCYIEGSDYTDRTKGYKFGVVKLLFMPDANNSEFGLCIRDMGMADFLGPTILYNPAQVKKGLHRKALMKLKFISGRAGFPTLKAGGKLEENIIFKIINGLNFRKRIY